MRILYLKTDIINTTQLIGGSIAHTMGVITALCQLGHKVAVASSHSLPHITTLPLLEFCPLKNPAWLQCLRWRINCIVSTFFFAFTAAKLIKKYKPHYIYQRYSPFNLTGSLLSWWYKIPLILEFNGSEVWVAKNWVHTNQTMIKTLKLLEWCEKKTLTTAAKIIVVSRAIHDQLIAQGYNSKKITIASNGVDPELFDPEKLQSIRANQRDKLHCNEKFVFGFSGTFSAWHGIETLATIAKELIQHIPHIYFIFIGDGPLLIWLKNELACIPNLSQHVIFTGAIAAQEVPHYLAMCDAFLCPTKPNSDGTPFFGSPTKLFEYLSLGKPIIASDLGQISEIIFPALSLQDLQKKTYITNQIGILVLANNTNDFIEAARELIKMPLQQQELLGKNARRSVLQNHTWNHHVNKILKEHF